MDTFTSSRNSYMEFDKIYFWTATINNWQKLLLPDSFKDVIIYSLDYLSKKNLIDVFGFVIMPNHIHLLWRMKEMNGKETPKASLLKFTAHQFKSMLTPAKLSKFKVTAENKKYEFWQRDPLAIEVYTPEIVYQKLDYIHRNPIAKNWNLARESSQYKYSSASYYEENDQHFNFLKHIGEQL